MDLTEYVFILVLYSSHGCSCWYKLIGPTKPYVPGLPFFKAPKLNPCSTKSWVYKSTVSGSSGGSLAGLRSAVAEAALLAVEGTASEAAAKTKTQE